MSLPEQHALSPLIFIGARFDILQQVTCSIKELAHYQRLVTYNEDSFLLEVRAVIDRVFSVLKESGNG